MMQDLIPEEEVPLTPTPKPTTTEQASVLFNLSADGTVASAQTVPPIPGEFSAASSVSTKAHPHDIDTPDSQVAVEYPGSLKGVRIIIIHVKDSMADGPPVGVTILKELNAHEARLRTQGKALGCEFVVSKGGESYWF